MLVVLSQRMGWRYIGFKKYSYRVVMNADLVGDGDAGGDYELLPVPRMNTTTGSPSRRQ